MIAKNRMFLVHTTSGQRFCLARRRGEYWYPPKGFDIETFETWLEDLFVPSGDNDAFELQLEANSDNESLNP